MIKYDKNKIKAIIVGANSYIARNMIKVLKNNEAVELVAAYDRQGHHNDDIKTYRQIDILDMESLKTADLKADHIFFFTGKTGTEAGFDQYDSFIDINEKGLLNLLTVYREQQSRAKIIFPSTRLVYKGKPGPQKEDSEKEFKTLYAVNKFACEQYLKMYAAVYGVKYCIFRICVPYGTLVRGASSYGTAEFMLERARKGENITLFGDGSIRRTLTYIEDLCKIMISGAMSPNCENDVFNIGGEDYSLRDMADLIAEKYNAQVEYVKWPETALKIESGDTVFESGKLDSIIEYNRSMTFEKWLQNERGGN